MSEYKHSAIEYLKYYFRAQTIYDIHSPFLYDFLRITTDPSRVYYYFQEMDKLRTQLLKNEDLIGDEDPGAGSHVPSALLQVRHVAANAVSSQQKSEWLYRTMLYLRPTSILELGSSLGVSALYMAGALPNAIIYTLEGRPSIIAQAKKNFQSLSASNINLISGDFKDTLPIALKEIDNIDFVILDGNHHYAPTVEYMSLILAHHRPTAILVDDIYWSDEMTRAWHEIKHHPFYNVCVDFYDYGLLLHRPEINEQIDVSFIEYAKKFWRLGFW